ncbi:hypothetical protein QJQ45_006070 [Haematococcus lacustris]|nr:hypothetical protein QJQ45_006070 [Haematococcus lacustris]
MDSFQITTGAQPQLTIVSTAGTAGTSTAAWGEDRSFTELCDGKLCQLATWLLWCCLDPGGPGLEQAAEPTEPTKGEGKGKGKAAKAKPAPQPGRWLDRDCNAALNMQRIGESRWRPLELCCWPDQGALPAKGKEYPGLGSKRLRDKPPKAQQQQQPAEAQCVNNAPLVKPSCTSTSADDLVRVATLGDIVTLHFVCKDSNGKGFDEAIRGLAVGQTTVIEVWHAAAKRLAGCEAAGGEWQRELLFSVPREHPEVQRLEGRYKNQGGLQEGKIVELANGNLAMVVELTAETVKIDANNMIAGKVLTFELEVISIDKAPQPAPPA